MAACSSVALLAGLVAATAAAVDADRATGAAEGEAAAARGDGTAAALSGGSPPSAAQTVGLVEVFDDRPRAGTDSGATVAVPEGWRDVATQRVVPVRPGRFDTVVALVDRGVVLVGGLPPTTPDRLAPEARRLAASYASALAPGTRPIPVVDTADGLDGRPAWTTTLRTAGGGTAAGGGAVVRVSTVAAAPGSPGRALLSVVRAGGEQAAEVRIADAVVRSLRITAGVRPGTPGPPPTGR